MMIDLRSDTVTQPTPEMRRAMAEAEVGDDVYGEDPTVARLEAMAAERMGMEAAVFVPSGTMANLAAVLTHCQRGDEMILGDLAHTYLYEAGGAAALGGVHPRALTTAADGTLDLQAIEDAIRPDDVHFPTTRLVCLENTHNRCGGAVLGVDYIRGVGDLVQRHGLRLHIDGARIFNAASALGVPASRLVGMADSVAFCLSKGLCAPVGSLLCGTALFIGRARKARKQLGGGMRQAGILAAAGIVALDSMVGRLAEDHQRARRLAQGLAQIPGVEVETPEPASNMVYFRLAQTAVVDAAGLQDQLRSRGVLIHPVGPRRVRLVLHYGIDDGSVEAALEALGVVLGG
ncbi:MAG: low-specificity L-threonine aldolase [Anaerolineales bacterium]|nr:low-specificity L-threonine aldolase [Anaerolineales bacterium]